MRGVTLVLLAMALAGCGPADPPPPGSSGTQVVPATKSAPEATAVPGTNAAPPQSWTMPNLVGKQLQAAQDAVQSVSGIRTFITLSHDATGQGRRQVNDRNWVVCGQNVAAGATFTIDTKIDFAVVKDDERCP